jgi:predicted ArsR family transcriptional regulator
MSRSQLRERVLAVMNLDPRAWRVHALAARLHTSEPRVKGELANLKAEGKLVVCEVLVPGRPSELEYRIAASAVSVPSRPTGDSLTR